MGKINNSNTVNINFDQGFLESLMNRSGNETVSVKISVAEFRKIIHESEMYRQFGAEVKNKAKKWDSLHPAIQQALENYHNQPIQITPVW